MTILDTKLESERVWPADGAWVPDSGTTLVDLLRRRALEKPENLACAFLNDGGRVAERLSYAELDREARRVAGRCNRRDRKGIALSCSFRPGSISSRRFSAACTPA